MWSRKVIVNTILNHYLDNQMDGFELNAAVCNSAMWACVKGGLWRDALHIFNLMEIKGQGQCMGKI